MNTPTRLKIIFTIPEARVVSELAPNNKGHWSRAWSKTRLAHASGFLWTQNALWKEYDDKEIPFTPPVKLTCSRFFTGNSKPFDEDALGSTFKPYIDGITEALQLGEYYIEKKTNKQRWKGYDDPDHMTMIFTQTKTDSHYLTFTIEELPPNVDKAWKEFKEVITNEPR